MHNSYEVESFVIYILIWKGWRVRGGEGRGKGNQGARRVQMTNSMQNSLQGWPRRPLGSKGTSFPPPHPQLTWGTNHWEILLLKQHKLNSATAIGSIKGYFPPFETDPSPLLGSAQNMPHPQDHPCSFPLGQAHGAHSSKTLIGVSAQFFSLCLDTSGPPNASVPRHPPALT